MTRFVGACLGFLLFTTLAAGQPAQKGLAVDTTYHITVYNHDALAKRAQ